MSDVVVCQPDEGESWWQPVPANGYAEVRVSARDGVDVGNLSSGIQVIAHGGHIREHQHGSEREILFFFEGRGRAVVNGESHPIIPGTTVFLGPGNRHTLINEGDGDLKMFWLLLPGGLEDFFEAIGRVRSPGDAAPDPFPRPDDVEAIEQGTVFAPLSDP
jgi:mannose-6-phosphate isomerase-like protein (cupin superfamily)